MAFISEMNWITAASLTSSEPCVPRKVTSVFRYNGVRPPHSSFCLNKPTDERKLKLSANRGILDGSGERGAMELMKIVRVQSLSDF